MTFRLFAVRFQGVTLYLFSILRPEDKNRGAGSVDFGDRGLEDHVRIADAARRSNMHCPRLGPAPLHRRPRPVPVTAKNGSPTASEDLNANVLRQ